MIHQCIRYCVCLLVLISQGIGQIVATGWCNTQHSFLCVIAQSFIAFLAAFTIQWCQIYSLGLTRAKHAFFDEFNVLETYQPRARTMGHLFMPEPPTPVPDAQRQQLNATKETERNAFLQMRDAHYGNEYTYVEKVNRELKEGGNLAKQSQNEVKNGISDTPKIEGPILIEFHADSESDDDDYSI
ncbi:Protein phosphatase inhibitor 2 (IPP-2) family protein [Acanthocheilonema viteae]